MMSDNQIIDALLTWLNRPVLACSTYQYYKQVSRAQSLASHFSCAFIFDEKSMLWKLAS